MDIVLIAALAENRVIGDEGTLPWHYPADLKHFKETTMGSPVIMGRKTYEDIAAKLDGPLPGRTNIVLSRQGVDAPESVSVVESIDAALAVAEEADAECAYVIGGASVYDQTLAHADRLVITEIPEAIEGDATFPAWDDENWGELSREVEGELVFVEYERR